MSKTLTEQWREGTLPEGLYYVDGKGNYDIALIRNRYCPVLTSQYCEDTVFEPEFVPVEPVPDYMDCKRLRYDSIELNKAKIKIYELVSKTEQLEKRLEIATKALKETKEKLLHVELSGLDGDNRQKMYDLMFEDGVIDKALKEMEGVK